jgi:hypothetical protein
MLIMKAAQKNVWGNRRTADGEYDSSEKYAVVFL